MNGKLADDVLTTTTPARQAADELGPLCRFEVGADEIEFRVYAVVGAVADEHNQKQIVARHGAADGVEILPHIGGRRGIRGVGGVAEDLEPGAFDLHALDEHGREIARPRGVLAGVLVAAAGAGDDERVALASGVRG